MTQQVEALRCVKQQTGKTEAFLLMDLRSLCGTSCRGAEGSGLGNIIGERFVIDDVVVEEIGLVFSTSVPTQL